MKIWKAWTDRLLRVVRDRKYFTMIVAALMTVAVFAIVYGVAMPRKYTLRVGELSKWDIDAPFDIEDYARTERYYADEAARAVADVYARDPELSQGIIDGAESFADMIVAEYNAYKDAMIRPGAGADTAVDRSNILDTHITRLCNQADSFDISISREEAESILEVVTHTELDGFFADFIAAVTEIADSNNITRDNINGHTASLYRSIQESGANQNLKNVACLFASSALSVNVTVDEAQTERQREAVRAQNPERKITVPAGQRMISVDTVVTAAQYQILEDNNLIEDGELDVERFSMVLFVLAAIAVLFYMYLNDAGMELIVSKSQVLQMACTIVAVLLVCRILYPIHRLSMPVYIVPILIAYLIHTRVAIVINIYLLSVLSLFYGIDVKTILFFMIGSMLGAVMMMNTSTRSRFTLVAVMLSTVCVLLFVALSGNIMTPELYYIDAIVLFGTCAASSFLSMGLVALMEGLFNTATPLRLTELSSGNTPLLRRLSFEAPGTHHHSLMVGHMAEAAAFAIGANPFITKTGAYYHDVGKLMAPGYFAENQNGVNPHDTAEPEESCAIIVSHTQRGVELCEKNKLPRRVVDIVRQHHGDTAVAYFYNKAVKLRGAENVSRDDYRYPGPRPSSREAALVMLADSCEAAVRSTDIKSETEITGWVRKIVKSKLDDGQMDACNIGTYDIKTIEQSFIRVLTGFYHTRIKYPEEVRALESAERDGGGRIANASSGSAGGNGYVNAPAHENGNANGENGNSGNEGEENTAAWNDVQKGRPRRPDGV